MGTPELDLDVHRAVAWLDANRGQRGNHFRSDGEGVYSFLLTLLPHLSWPRRDARWATRSLAVLAYFSREADGNFLLRRSVPPTVPMLGLSQTRFDAGTNEYLESFEAERSPAFLRVDASAPWLREVDAAEGGLVRSAVLVPIPAAGGGGRRIWGVLLVVERAPVDAPHHLLASSLGRYLDAYMSAEPPPQDTSRPSHLPTRG